MSDKSVRELNKATIKELVEGKIPFTFVDNSGCAWNDHFLDDIVTDEDCLRFMSKWKTDAYVMQKPYMGNLAYPTGGIVEVKIPYENILLIIRMDPSEDMKANIKEKCPQYLNYLENHNKEEVGIIPEEYDYGGEYDKYKKKKKENKEG